MVAVPNDARWKTPRHVPFDFTPANHSQQDAAPDFTGDRKGSGPHDSPDPLVDDLDRQT